MVDKARRDDHLQKWARIGFSTFGRVGTRYDKLATNFITIVRNARRCGPLPFLRS